MNSGEQVEAFERDLWAIVCRYYAEFDLSPHELIGALEKVKLDTYSQQFEWMEDDYDDY